MNSEQLPWVKLLKQHAPPHRDLMETFRTFIHAAACAVACGQREEDYFHAIRGWTSEELQPFGDVLGQLILDMDAADYTDVIGPAYEAFEGKGNKQRTGSFYTPPSLTDLIARLQTPTAVWPERGPLTVHEPAGGSGGMLLALVRELRGLGAPPQSIRIQTWDVNRLACDMAYLNLTLHGVPAEVVWGDTLRLEVSGSWRNVWYWAAHGWDGGRVRPSEASVLPGHNFGPLFEGAI